MTTHDNPWRGWMHQAVARGGRIGDQPLFLSAASETVFALSSKPATVSRDVGVVLLGGGWFGTSAGRNRIFVELAHALAELGFEVVRLDWHGMGESTGEIDNYQLDAPFVDDLLAATNALKASGVRRVVLLGICFGARTALAGLGALSDLAGLVLASVPVEQAGASPGGFRVSSMATEMSLREVIRRAAHPVVFKGLLDPGMRSDYRKAVVARLSAITGQVRRRAGPAPTSTVEPTVLAGLREAADRGAPVLWLYGEDDVEYAGYRAHLHELHDALSATCERVEVRTVPGTLPGFARLETQRAFITTVVQWMQAHFPEERTAP